MPTSFQSFAVTCPMWRIHMQGKRIDIMFCKNTLNP